MVSFRGHTNEGGEKNSLTLEGNTISSCRSFFYLLTNPLTLPPGSSRESWARNVPRLSSLCSLSIDLSRKGEPTEVANGGKLPLRSHSGDDHGELDNSSPLEATQGVRRLSLRPSSHFLRLASIEALAPPPTSLKDPDLMTVNLLRPSLGLDLTFSTKAWKAEAEDRSRLESRLGLALTRSTSAWNPEEADLSRLLSLLEARLEGPDRQTPGSSVLKLNCFFLKRGDPRGESARPLRKKERPLFSAAGVVPW